MTTLNLVDRVLETARTCHHLGLNHQSSRLLRRLAAFRDLPAETAAETQQRLGELLLQRRSYRPARRHLAAALAQQPDNARSHYQMGAAIEQDPEGDPERALLHYRRAVRLDPDNGEYQSELGLCALNQDEREEGLEALRRAFALSSHCPVIVAKVLDGLCEAGETDEARSLLRTALFRNPRDPRFVKLWNDFRFHALRTEQERARRAAWWGEDGPTVLPFVRPESAPSGRTVRRDRPAPRPAPHLPRSGRVPGRKHA